MEESPSEAMKILNSLSLGQGAESTGLHVVVGATSALGRTVVDRLLADSRKVRAVVFGPSPVRHPFPEGTDVVVANPLESTSISSASAGAYAIYDCFEPIYSRWKENLARVTPNLLLAAIDTGATFVMASHLLDSETDNEKIEKDVLAANFSQLAKTVVVRLPQLYGPGEVNELWKNLFDSAAQGRKAHWMGDPDVPRDYLYVSDAANAMVLMGRSLWTHGRAWNVPGPGPLTGKEIIQLAFRASGREPILGVWGRGVMITGRFLASEARGYLELPYDYYKAFSLDGSEFSEAFPSWNYTPHAEAMKTTLEWFKGSN